MLQNRTQQYLKEDSKGKVLMGSVKLDDVHRRLLLIDGDEAAVPPSSTDEMDQDRRTLIQKAINQTFQCTAHLANLLPTGTVLAFQLLSPIFSNGGRCDPVSQSMTASLVALCGLSCFFSSFTDSFRDARGKVRYGLATPNGFWVIDAGDGDGGSGAAAALTPEDRSKFKLKTMDFVHAFLSVLVFAAIALFDQSVVECFYPSPDEETTEVLTALPVGIGVVCSMLFVVFPTTRHGIGFPLSPR